jgi:hypothetical protein
MVNLSSLLNICMTWRNIILYYIYIYISNKNILQVIPTASSDFGGIRNDISCDVACCLNFETIWFRCLYHFFHAIFYFIFSNRLNKTLFIASEDEGMQFQDTNAEIILGFLIIFCLFTLVDPIFYFSFSLVRYLHSSSYYFFTFVGNNAMFCCKTFIHWHVSSSGCTCF